MTGNSLNIGVTELFPHSKRERERERGGERERERERERASKKGNKYFNLLNAKLNPICHLLALLGAHHILHVSRIRVKGHLTL